MAATRPLNENDVPDLQLELAQEIRRALLTFGNIGGQPRPAEPLSHLNERFEICIEYAKGALALSREDLPAAMATLERAVLEQVIAIRWATLSPDNALRLKDAALEEMARLVRNLIAGPHGRIVRRSTGEDATAEFQAQAAMVHARRPPRFDIMAREAGLERLYAQLYGMLSLIAHGNAPAFMRDGQPHTAIGLETMKTLLLAVRETMDHFYRESCPLPLSRMSEILGVEMQEV